MRGRATSSYFRRSFVQTTGQTRTAKSSTTIHSSFRVSALALREKSSGKSWRGAKRGKERSRPRSRTSTCGTQKVPHNQEKEFRRASLLPIPHCVAPNGVANIDG